MECTNGGGGGTESGGERKEEEVCFIHSPDLLLSFDRNPRYTGRVRYHVISRDVTNWNIKSRRSWCIL